MERAKCTLKVLIGLPALLQKIQVGIFLLTLTTNSAPEINYLRVDESLTTGHKIKARRAS